MKPRLQRLVQRLPLPDLDETEAHSVVGGMAFVIGVLIAALAWGDSAVDIVLAAAVLALVADRVAVHHRTDVVSDEADIARGKAEAIERHLTGADQPSSGRHSHR